MEGNLPFISVIVATRNEENNIESCLKSVLAQTYPQDKIEVIVVDNNSTDKTKEIALKYTDKVFDLKEQIDLNGIKNFRGAQLNLGVEKSRGEIIFFPDADMTFHKDLLREAMERLRALDALYVPEIVCGKGFFGKMRNFERSFYNQTCIDGVRFAKKEVFQKIGGFDIVNIAFGPDDWDFTKTLKKNNFKLGITKKNIFHHEEWLDWKTYINKKTKYVATFDSYIAKWGKNDPDIRKQFGIYYRFLGVFVENGRWKKILAQPILFGGMMTLRVLVGLKFLMRKK